MRSLPCINVEMLMSRTHVFNSWVISGKGQVTFLEDEITDGGGTGALLCLRISVKLLLLKLLVILLLLYMADNIISSGLNYARINLPEL